MLPKISIYDKDEDVKEVGAYFSKSNPHQNEAEQQLAEELDLELDVDKVEKLYSELDTEEKQETEVGGGSKSKTRKNKKTKRHKKKTKRHKKKSKRKSRKTKRYKKKSNKSKKKSN